MGVATITRRPTSGAYRFATNQYLITKDSRTPITTGNQLTIAAWLYCTNWATAGQRCITLGSGNVVYLGTSATAGKPGRLLVFITTTGNQTLDFGTGMTFTNNSWVHLAATYDGDGDRVMRGYLNGVASSDTLTVAGGNAIGWGAAGKATIGAQDGGGGSYWNGGICDMAMWSAALRAPEIAALYRRDDTPLDLRPEKLGADWPLDGQMDDLSVHGCHLRVGTLPTVDGGPSGQTRPAIRTI